MSKTVIFTDLYTVEVEMIQSNGDLKHIAIIYGLVTDEDLKYPLKRLEFKPEDLSPAELVKVEEFMGLVVQKVKTIEEL